VEVSAVMYLWCISFPQINENGDGMPGLHTLKVANDCLVGSDIDHIVGMPARKEVDIWSVGVYAADLKKHRGDVFVVYISPSNQQGDGDPGLHMLKVAMPDGLSINHLAHLTVIL